MSLYGLQKLMYELNRDEALQSQYRADKDSILRNFKLDAEEHQAIDDEDIGLLYILGVNGQILMHFAAMCGYAGIATHGGKVHENLAIDAKDIQQSNVLIIYRLMLFRI